MGGFTLIEVLLATGLSTLLVVAAYSIFSNNQVTARKNAWRFAFEDSARFSLEVINEKFSLAGHTLCAEIGDYDMDAIDSPVPGPYTPGANLLYQVANPANNRFGQLQAYNGDAGNVLAANNWYPTLNAAIAPSALTNAINPAMDAVVVRSLGKHVFSVVPVSAAATGGGPDCNAGAAGRRCIFRLLIDNPLIDSTLSFDNDPMFFDVSYNADAVVNSIFPMAVTDCATVNSVRFMNFALQDRPAGSEIEGADNLQYWVNLPNTLVRIPIINFAQILYSQAANFDLIYVANNGQLFITRPGRIPDSDPAQVGLNSVPLTPPPTGNRGDVIVTGFRVLYGTTTAAGLPSGFLRPDSVVAWEQVRLVRYAISFEIVDYHTTIRPRPATNLLDQAVAADNSRNLRRIYEQVIYINN
ncbi:MAG: hypothetical protein K0U66_10600 [Gammaproteobacteria bacterium]|nr:hypothetical protein [Gammaproteobacteria bacterium]